MGPRADGGSPSRGWGRGPMAGRPRADGAAGRWRVALARMGPRADGAARAQGYRARPMTTHPLQAIEGVPESALADADAAGLPASSAPAPWTTRLQAMVWWHRAAPAAAEHLPAPLR